MKCSICGAEFEGNTCPNGCGAKAQTGKAKKPIYKKWWFWMIIVVLALSLFSTDDAETPDATKPSGGSTSATIPDSNTTSPAPTTQAPTEENNMFYPGDIINANGLKITYVASEKYVTDNMFMQPEEGFMHIRLKISAENTSDSDKYISSFEFTCYANGAKMDSTFFSDGDLAGGTLSAGRKTEGYIYFKVPISAASIEVEYETSFWTGEKAILVVEITE